MQRTVCTVRVMLQGAVGLHGILNEHQPDTRPGGL
jgi:hypothetical protein